MQHAMRRSAQQLSRADIEKILKEGSHGVLAVHGDDFPYAVPLSYIWENERIYFHCATQGHKLKAIQADRRVSFCVVGKDEVLPERFATHYESVIVFGHATLVTDPIVKRHALEMLIQKYSPGYEHEGAQEINQEWEQVQIVEIDVQHCTGKHSRY